MATKTIEICGWVIKSNGGPNPVCDKKVGHPRACSNEFSRAYNKDAKRKHDDKKRKLKAAKESAPASLVQDVGENQPFTVAQFHEQNVAKLEKSNPSLLAEYRQAQEIVLDNIHFFEHGHEVPETDMDYVGLAEGLEDAEAFIAEQGGEVVWGPFCFSEDTQVEQEMKNGLDAWQQRYWLYEKAFAKICAINKPTEVYAKLGLVISIPDQKLRDFKERVRQRPYHDDKLVLDESRWRSGLSWTDYAEQL